MLSYQVKIPKILLETYKISMMYLNLAISKKNHETYSIKNDEFVGMFKIETLKNFSIGKAKFLRSKAFSNKSEMIIKIQLKGISKTQSKNIFVDEYYNYYLEENIKKIVISIL